MQRAGCGGYDGTTKMVYMEGILLIEIADRATRFLDQQAAGCIIPQFFAPVDNEP